MKTKIGIFLFIFILITISIYSEESQNSQVQNAMKSVVIIEVKCNDFVQYLTPQMDIVDSLIEESSGSGIILTSDGIIVTNFHVIDKSTKITVILYDGKKYPAKVLIEDPYSDLALIKIEETNLSPITIGNHHEFHEGDDCWAIGNPENQGLTITKGIITSKSQFLPHDTLIERSFRFNAKVFPGNSGGALVDNQGRLIGIPNLKEYVDASYQKVYDFNLAISVDLVKNLLQEYQVTNTFSWSWLGCSILTNNETNRKYMNYTGDFKHGYIVEWVFPNTNALKMGLKRNDIILQIDQKQFLNIVDIQNYIIYLEPGTEVSVKINRSGIEKDLKIICSKLNLDMQKYPYKFCLFHFLGLEFKDLKVVNIAKGSLAEKVKIPKKKKLRSIVPGQNLNTSIEVRIYNEKDLEKCVNRSYLTQQFGMILTWSMKPEEIILLVTEIQHPSIL